MFLWVCGLSCATVYPCVKTASYYSYFNNILNNTAMKQCTVEIKNTSEGLRINGQLCNIRTAGKVVVIENGSAGIGHSAHPNIDISGSVKGMKKLGYWREDAITHKQGGFIYNLSSVVIGDPIDALAYYLEKGGEMPRYAKDEWKVNTFTFSI